jgi:hypothetical protein
MKNLLVAICCVVSYNACCQENNFGSELGDYVEISNHHNAKGLDFKFRKPSGYNEMNGSSSNSVKLYSSGNSSLGDREIIIQIFDYETYWPEGRLINRSNVLDVIGEQKVVNSTFEYFSINQYPGWIFQAEEDNHTSLQVNVFLEKNLFVISFISVYLIGESDIAFIKKLANSVEFD